MKLFYSHASPYARKVNIILHLCSLADSCELITTTIDSDELRAQNPLGKIPALIDGDRTLFESQIICEYLCKKAQTQRKLSFDFYQRESESYYDIQTAHALANGITESAVSIIMETRRETEPSPRWLKRWHTAIEKSLAQVNTTFLGDSSNINIASVAMIAGLGYLDFRLIDFNWRSYNEELADWYKNIENESWVTKTAPQ